MNPWVVVPDHVMLALGWTLLHFVWQGALVAALLAIAQRAFDPNASGPRYLLAATALLAMVALPVATFVKLSGDLVHAEHLAPPALETAGVWTDVTSEPGSPAGQTWVVRAGSLTESAAPHGAALRADVSVEVAANGDATSSWSIVTEGDAPTAFASETAGAPVAPPVNSAWLAAQTAARTVSRILAAAVARGFDRGTPHWMPWIVALWGWGVTLLTLRLVGGWLVTQRIRRAVIDDPGDRLQRTLERLIVRMRVSRPLRVFRSALVEVPTVIGWLRPVILVPVSAMSGLTPAQFEALLAHELAHIRRHDYLINLLQTVVETLLFYHPAVWWVSGRVREERENCCDDLAVEACGDRVTYARALCELERLRLPAISVAMAANGGSLLHRIRRLVQPAPPASLASRCGAGLVLVGSMLVVVLGLAPAAVGERGVHQITNEGGFYTASAVFTRAPDAPAAPAPATLPEPAPLDLATAEPCIVDEPCEAQPAPEPRPHAVAEVPCPPADAPAPLADPQLPGPGQTAARAPVLAPGDSRGTLPRLAPAAPVTRPSSPKAAALNTWIEVARDAQRQAQQGVWQWVRGNDSRRQARTETRTSQREVRATTYAYRVAGAPDPADERRATVYRDALRQAGYQSIDDEHLELLMTQGVGAPYAKNMAEALGSAPDLETLLSMRVTGVTPEYARLMSEALGGALEPEDLVGLRARGVDPDYAREMRNAVGETLDPEEMMVLRMRGVTPEEARTLASIAGESPDVEALMALKGHDVSAEYAREIAARVSHSVSVEDLIDLRRQNVTPEKLDALQRFGIDPSDESLVELRSHGISLGYVAQMRHFRGHDLSLDQLIDLHDSGIEPEMVGALNVLGYNRLTEDELVELAQAGLTVDQIAQLTSAFGRALRAEELLELQQDGVNVVYAANMAHLSGVNLSVEDIVQLHQHEVSSAFVAALVEIGYPHRSVEDIVTLADRGVRARYLATLKDAGYGAVDPNEAAEMAGAGLSAGQIRQANRSAKRRLSPEQLLDHAHGRSVEVICPEKK